MGVAAATARVRGCRAAQSKIDDPPAHPGWRFLFVVAPRNAKGLVGDQALVRYGRHDPIDIMSA